MRCLSAGSAIAESVYACMGALATGFLRADLSDPRVEEALPSPELNALMR
ncbi:hypothetical protein P2318_19890 [Myxococcaceae bacterium GXIMD 01537]